MFSYLHDRMHIAGFWMGQNRWLKRWFVAARDAHDIHHRALNDEGFMDKNFGIGFFLFDRLFGTLSNGRPVFNQYGYAKALRRFDEVLEPWEKKEERTLMSVAPKSDPRDGIAHPREISRFHAQPIRQSLDLTVNIGTPLHREV